jgi:alkyl hydroperoxide reductase subunit F
MLELLQTLESLSDKISLQVRAMAGPRAVLRPGHPGPGHPPAFAGLPMGHEFTSLVLALLQVGGHPSKATAE